MTNASLHERIEAGQAYIPEERMRDGAIREFSVQENLFLHEHTSPKYTHGIFLNFAKMAAHARMLVSQFSVKTPGARYADQESVRRQHPEGDHGARAFARARRS